MEVREGVEVEVEGRREGSWGKEQAAMDEGEDSLVSGFLIVISSG